MPRRVSRRTFIASATASVLPSAVACAQPRSGGLLSSLVDGPAQGSAAGAWHDAGVIDLSHSPYAKLKTVPVRAVVIEDGFWSQRRRTNLMASIPSMLVDDFLIPHYGPGPNQKGIVSGHPEIEMALIELSRTTASPGMWSWPATSCMAMRGSRCDLSRPRPGYFPVDSPVKGSDQPTTLKLIPYYAWANREEAAMQVWIPYRDA